MTFRVMTPRSGQRPQIATHASPSMSQYGRSPSLVPQMYTTDDIAAARYAKLSWWMHCLRIAITIITLAVSIAIIACTAVSLRAYSDSHLEPEWLLPLWPLNVDLRPTHAVLACGILIMLFSLAYLIVAFIPLPRRLHHLNLASTALTIPSLILALITTIFASMANNSHLSSTSSGSLESWTCKWQGLEAVAPANFLSVCNHSSVALDLVILVVIVETFSLLSVIGGWYVEMRLKGCSVGGGKSDIELV